MTKGTTPQWPHTTSRKFQSSTGHIIGFTAFWKANLQPLLLCLRWQFPMGDRKAGCVGYRLWFQVMKHPGLNLEILLAGSKTSACSRFSLSHSRVTRAFQESTKDVVESLAGSHWCWGKEGQTKWSWRDSSSPPKQILLQKEEVSHQETTPDHRQKTYWDL